MHPKKSKRRDQVIAGGQSHAPKPTFDPAALAERAGCQKEAFRKFATSDVLFLIGPAGTGKTHVATKLAWDMLSSGQAESVIITRPAVGCGNKTMGYLPGDAKEKMKPWLAPFQDVLASIVGSGTLAAKALDQFESLSLEFVRGRTFHKCVAILDEGQNASIDDIRTYLTRLGWGGKIIVCGDPGQSDIAGGGIHLDIIADEMEKEGAAVVRFPDSAIVRHPFIANIERVFRRIKGVKK